MNGLCLIKMPFIKCLLLSHMPIVSSVSIVIVNNPRILSEIYYVYSNKEYTCYEHSILDAEAIQMDFFSYSDILIHRYEKWRKSPS